MEAPAAPETATSTRRWASDTGLATLVAAVAILVYLNSIPNGFVIDDQYQVVENPWLAGPRHLGEIFDSGVWDFQGRASNYYRPLMYVLYLGVATIAGRTAWAFHLVNVLLHAAVTALVFLLARRLYERDGRRSRWPAVVAALLFAVHPIHTEAVAWVAAVVDLAVAFFGLGALLTYDLGRTRGSRWFVLTGASVLAGLLFKETAVAIVPLIFAWEWTIVESRPRSFRALAPAAVALTVSSALYVGLRWNALGALIPIAGGAGTGVDGHALAAIALIATHIDKLLLPVGLNVWHVFSPPTSWTSAAAVVDLAVVSAAVAAAVWGGRRRRTVAFGGLLMALPLLPTLHFSAITTGVSGAFAERYLYLPSVGFVLVVATVFDAIRRNGPRAHRLAITMLSAVLLAYTGGTVARNLVWKDSLTLWEDAARKSPGSGTALFNYGSALRFRGRTEEGEEMIRRGVALAPELVDREIGKGRAFLQHGLLKESILAFHTALYLDPGNPDAYFGLGLAHEARNEPTAAKVAYRRALESRPDHAESHNNLGILLAVEGHLDEARGHFLEAVRLHPDDPSYRTNLERASRP